ncbi:hypothetical protein PSMK_12560 [Phycisphaera mikurensis NBRC 102666]|uniref:Uncharacterized protein n=1 Tax=Phycisphaera mikurensis (strain NBRC 102666 / KCTC 22515 / FYK2301M01) TaxID=1142394 RepID=I0IDS7_PHYMF|nr:hypothetical protein PSMK_12560 [Phycisphaera mikurensis NBRC 102666]
MPRSAEPRPGGPARTPRSASDAADRGRERRRTHAVRGTTRAAAGEVPPAGGWVGLRAAGRGRPTRPTDPS